MVNRKEGLRHEQALSRQYSAEGAEASCALRQDVRTGRRQASEVRSQHLRRGGSRGVPEGDQGSEEAVPGKPDRPSEPLRLLRLVAPTSGTSTQPPMKLGVINFPRSAATGVFF